MGFGVSFSLFFSFFFFHFFGGVNQTLRGINAASIVTSGGPGLVKLTERSDACGNVHGEKARVVVVGGIKGPDHLLLLPREELVMVVMIPATAANEVDPQVLGMVVVVVAVGAGCGCRGGNEAVAGDSQVLVLGELRFGAA